MTQEIQKIIDKLNIHWYVLNYDINTDTIDRYDVCSNLSFLKSAIESFIKAKNSVMSFGDSLQVQAMSHFWAKCEYEVLVSGWPPSKDRKEEIKIDAYDQLRLNWNVFVQFMYKAISEASGEALV